jgi:hypothetical protein
LTKCCPFVLNILKDKTSHLYKYMSDISRGVIFSKRKTLRARSTTSHREGEREGNGGENHIYIYVPHLSVQVYMSPNLVLKTQPPRSAGMSHMPQKPHGLVRSPLRFPGIPCDLGKRPVCFCIVYMVSHGSLFCSKIRPFFIGLSHLRHYVSVSNFTSPLRGCGAAHRDLFL